jgi:hypothetical protein
VLHAPLQVRLTHRVDHLTPKESPMTNHRDHSAAPHDLHLLTHPGLWLCAVAAAFAMTTTAHATSSPEDLQPPSDAQSLSPRQAYQHDRDFCNSGQATEPRALCLKEAARAYNDDRAGKLVRPDNEQAMSGNRHHRHQMNRANASGTGSAGWQDKDRDNDMHPHHGDQDSDRH